MSMERGEVASVAEATPMLLALRLLPWDGRAMMLETLRVADWRLWHRCIEELGADEILLSAMVLSVVADFVGPIPLPDGSTGTGRRPSMFRRRSIRGRRKVSRARSPSPDSSSTEYVPVAERGWPGVPPRVADDHVQSHRGDKKRRRLEREAAGRRVRDLGACVLLASGRVAVDRLWAEAQEFLSRPSRASAARAAASLI